MPGAAAPPASTIVSGALGCVPIQSSANGVPSAGGALAIRATRPLRPVGAGVCTITDVNHGREIKNIEFFHFVSAIKYGY